MAAASSGFSWKDAATIFIAVVAPLATGSLWVVRESDLKRFEERCAIVSDEISRIKEHDDRVEAKVDAALISVGTAISRMDSHLREADGHIRTIEHTRTRVDTVERQVSGLLSSPGARPDSYSGSDARDRAKIVDAEFQGLRGEIKTLDRRVDALEAEAARNGNGNGKVKR